MDFYFILLSATNLSIIGNFISMETKMQLEFPKIYLQGVSGVQPVLKMIYLQIFPFRKNMVLLKSALSLFWNDNRKGEIKQKKVDVLNSWNFKGRKSSKVIFFSMKVFKLIKLIFTKSVQITHPWVHTYLSVYI